MTRDDDALRSAIRAAANEALVRGAWYALLLGLTSGTLVVALQATGAADGLEAPAGFAFAAAGLSFAVHRLGRAGRAHGWVLYAVILSFVSLPTFFFVAAQALLPSGAATYVTGPISYLYIVLVILTGFLFDARLSLLAGLVAAGGYLLSYVLARPALLGIAVADPILWQDLTALPIYVIKCFMIAFSGVFVAGLSVIARRLVRRTLDERTRRERVHRLLGRYVSDPVADALLADRGSVAGTRRSVAILFSDLRGFSTYSEHATPEQVVAHLNEYFDGMVDAIAASGGVVDKFIGDALMAVFGGVLPLDAPCEAALASARAMRARLRELNARWAAAGRPVFEHGIGLHFGEVLQGDIGSANRMDFTVIGDAVNIAARVEGLTKQLPSRVLLTEAVHARLPESARAACVPLGSHAVRGREEPVVLYGLAE